MEASIAQQYADLSGRISQDQLMDPRAQVTLLLRSAKERQRATRRAGGRHAAADRAGHEEETRLSQQSP